MIPIKNIFTIILLLILLNGCTTSPKIDFEPPIYPPPPEEPRFIYESTIRSSADIKTFTAAEKFKIFATGSSGSAYGLAKPFGVAVHEGRVYVSDTVQRAVLMFDVPRGEFKYIGNEGQGALSKPLGLDIDPEGNLYVADNTAKRITVYNKDGKFLRALGGKKVFSRPTGLALSPDGSKVYVVDTGGIETDKHQVIIFDAKSGEVLDTVGKRGTNDGEFNLPLQITVANDGTFYVVDGGNFRVQAFNPDNSFKLKWGTVGRRLGQFSRPKGITTDKDGNIYVIDAAFGNFQIFNDKGQLLMHVGDRGGAGAPGEYMLPSGVDVDEDGRVYMVDQFFRKLDIYRPTYLNREDGFLGTTYIQKVLLEKNK
jgi:DNA-binding beta-propeller fold protein YncE